MRFLRTKISLVFIVILSIMALFAVIMSIKVSITMLEKRSRIIRVSPEEKMSIKTGTRPASNAKTAEIDRDKSLALFYNGEKTEGLQAYLTTDGEVLLPLDFIFKMTSGKFMLYNSDDIMEGNINGKELIVKFSDGSIYIDKVKMTSGTPPAVAKNHILVPARLLNYIDGFRVDEYPDRDTLFVNYHKDFNLLKAETDKWADNGIIPVSTEDRDLSYDNYGKHRAKTESTPEPIGYSLKGEAFFIKNSSIYCESAGKENKVFEPLWKCDYISGLSAKGPYVAVSAEEDAVFYMTGDSSMMIGKSSMLPVSYCDTDGKADFRRSILVQPDGKRFIVLQNENGFISLVVIETDNHNVRNIVLNFSEDSMKNYGLPESKWLSDDRLFLYTGYKGWIIDLSGQSGIYNWIYGEIIP